MHTFCYLEFRNENHENIFFKLTKKNLAEYIIFMKTFDKSLSKH